MFAAGIDCGMLLHQIQMEVSQYALREIWNDNSAESVYEEYKRSINQITNRKKFVGTILNTKKPNDEKHMIFNFNTLSKHTTLLTDKQKGQLYFHYVKSAAQNHGRTGLTVTLNKKNVMSSVLKTRHKLRGIVNVLDEDEELSGVSIVCHSDSVDVNDICTLRGILLSTVARNILQSKRRKTCFYLLCKGVLYELSETNLENLSRLDGNNDVIKLLTPTIPSSNPPETTTMLNVMESLRACRYCVFEENDNKNIDGDDASDSMMEIDAKRYVQCELESEKGHLCKDVGRIKVTSSDGRETDYIRNLKALKNIPSAHTLLHIVPCRMQYKVKSTSLLCDIIFSKYFQYQMFCAYEGGTVQDEETVEKSADLSRILQSRNDELRSSYQSRYASEMEGAGWEGVIADLTDGSLKLDIFSTALTRKIRMGHSSNENFTSQKSMFILYNYARLCKIEEHFHERINEGLHGDLPSAEQIDFSVLTEHLEWCLTLRYGLGCQALFEGLHEPFMSPACSMTRCHIPAEKIYSFLSNLSRDFSKYYKETKVLLDPQPHLLMLMYARVHLVLTMKKVMSDCFDLLGVSPPQQM